MILDNELRPVATLLSNFICSFFNLTLIVLINKIFERVAKKLTKWGI